MKSAFLFLFLILALNSVNAQNYKFLPDVLCTIGDQTIYVPTFERAYNKNYNVNASEKQGVEDYFSLYLKFRLKVTAALDTKMDTITSFKKELKSYRDQLAKSYLIDNEGLENLLKETYFRTANEVKVSHIMVRLSENASPTDTLAAFKKISDIRKRIVAGESFENLALELSDDPSAKKNSGNMGFFKAFQFPYSFESISYNTPVGQISQPCRTKFGYHIIKVYEKRPSVGEVKVAHIMISIPQDSPAEKWNAGQQKILAFKDSISKGIDFGILANKYSEDKNSAKNKGELEWFGAGRMVPEFAEAAFSLKNPGDISLPIKTPFGWHLIKLINKREVGTYASLKSDLKNKIMNDERGQLLAASYSQKLLKEEEYKEYPENLTCFYSLDTAIYSGNYKLLKASQLVLQVFTIQKQIYTVEEFSKYLEKHKKPATTVTVKDFIRSSLTAFSKISILEYEDQHLEDKYIDFKNLTDEYHDGILLFNIMDQEVWGKATRDTLGLEQYFKQTASKYVWNDRLDATIYKFKNIATATKAQKVLKKTPNINSLKLTNLICDSLSNSGCVEADTKLFSKGDNAIIDSITWKKGLTKVFVNKGTVYIVAVNAILKPEPKKFIEVKGLVTAEYQNVLEEKWLNELNSKYKVVINQELLHKIADKYKTSH